MKHYFPYQFSIFRIILGTYLFIHFANLIPYAAELWSSAGLLPDPASNLTYGYFPNVLLYFSGPTAVKSFVAILSILALLFTIGFQRQITALLLWYGWVCLFDRNNLILNPGIPYIGWILLCCIAIPRGEPISISKKTIGKQWEFPMILFVGAWVLMSLGYTISGVDKLLSPSWKDGTALIHLLENPLARDSWVRNLLLQLPENIIRINTWLVLTLEIVFLPFAIFKGTRMWIWLAMIGLHIGILIIVDFADLTLGMLMIHWFTFDGRWLKEKPFVFFVAIIKRIPN